MKNTAFYTPVTVALMSGLTYAAVVAAMFTSLSNVAKAESLAVEGFAMEPAPFVAWSMSSDQIQYFSAAAAGVSAIQKQTLVSNQQATQLHQGLQKNVSSQLTIKLEKMFNQNLKEGTIYP